MVLIILPKSNECISKCAVSAVFIACFRAKAQNKAYFCALIPLFALHFAYNSPMRMFVCAASAAQINLYFAANAAGGHAFIAVGIKS